MRNFYFTKHEIEEMKALGLTDDQIGDLWKPMRRLFFAFNRDWPLCFSNVLRAIKGPEDFNLIINK